MVSHQPLLSVVAVSRNDDHGGNMLGRMQLFVDGFVGQCRRHGLDAELILVEWNPPGDRPHLAEALSWPEEPGPASIRVVTVPAELHARLPHAEALPLFQMIGKNVGIRRARGRFILATNVDILLNDETVCYLRDSLVPGTLVRVDRFDVSDEALELSDLDQALRFCDATFTRVATRYGLYDRASRTFLGAGSDPIHRTRAARYTRALEGELAPLVGSPRRRDPREQFRRVRRLATGLLKATWATVRYLLWLVSKLWPPHRIPVRAYWLGRRMLLVWPRSLLGYLQPLTSGLPRLPARLRGAAVGLHTYACGDFTLLAREDWERLRGYPEWPMYSWHIDSTLLYTAHAHGIRQVVLPPEHRAYHMEHALGSGWSPEGAQKLFDRLAERGIPYLTDPDLERWGRRCARDPGSCVVNDPGWGFGGIGLPEVTVLKRRRPTPGTTSLIRRDA